MGNGMQVRCFIFHTAMRMEIIIIIILYYAHGDGKCQCTFQPSMNLAQYVTSGSLFAQHQNIRNIFTMFSVVPVCRMVPLLDIHVILHHHGCHSNPLPLLVFTLFRGTVAVTTLTGSLSGSVSSGLPVRHVPSAFVLLQQCWRLHEPSSAHRSCVPLRVSVSILCIAWSNSARNRNVHLPPRLVESEHQRAIDGLMQYFTTNARTRAPEHNGKA